MATNYEVSILDGTKATVVVLAALGTVDADSVAVSFGDTVGVIRTTPINVAVDNIRRAIEEGLVTEPGTVPLFGVKSDVVNIADIDDTLDESMAVAVGANVLPKSVSTQFRQRLYDIVHAVTEGLV